MKRRTFLKIGAGGAAAGAVALPLLDQLESSRAAAIDPSRLANHPDREHLVLSACDMCGAQDPVLLQIEDGRVVATYANAGSSYSAGVICGKAHAALEKAYHPSRITRPMMRRGPGRFEPVSWDEAIGFMSERLARIADRYGENAVHAYMGLSSQSAVWKSFWKTTFGTKNVFGNDGVCDSGRRTAGGLTLGDTRPLPDLQHTKVGVVFGADYLSSTKYLWYPDHMLAALDRGARFYIVDPRFSETAARAVAYGGKWVPIKPGTDAALANAMAHVVFADPGTYAERMNPALVTWSKSGGWQDGPKSFGVDKYARALKDKTPEWAESITGVPADLIRTMADDLVMSDAPLVDAWTGVAHYSNGTSGVRAVFCLGGIVNAIDRRGGLVRQNGFKGGKAGCRPIPGASYRTVGHAAKLATACGMYSFVRSDVNNFVPRAMLDPTFAVREYRRRRGTDPDSVYDYPVKAFISHTRNFANGNSGSPLWREAFTKLLADPDGLIVDINLFVSEQGAHSHLVLPEAAYTERDDIFKPSSLYPAVHIRKAAVAPMGESKTMLEIARLLAAGLAGAGFKGGGFGVDQVVPYQSYEQVMKTVAGSDEVYRTLSEQGFWQAADLTPRYGDRDFGFSKLGKATKTFDFYVSSLAGEDTPADRRHPDAPASFDIPRGKGFEPLPLYRPSTKYAETTDEFPLRLVACGRNQWTSASKTQHLATTIEKEPENVLTIHPSDAAARNIHSGDRVRVRSATGAGVDIKVLVSEGMRPGSVHMSNGFGQSNTTESLARRRGANVNELTDPDNIDPISGADALAEVHVAVEALS